VSATYWESIQSRRLTGYGSPIEPDWVFGPSLRESWACRLFLMRTEPESGSGVHTAVLLKSVTLCDIIFYIVWFWKIKYSIKDVLFSERRLNQAPSAVTSASCGTITLTFVLWPVLTNGHCRSLSFLWCRCVPSASWSWERINHLLFQLWPRTGWYRLSTWIRWLYK